MIRHIAITGSHGFIAGYLRRRLEAFPDRYAVRGVSLRDGSWRGTGFCGCDCVVHTAGIAHVASDASMDDAYYAVNRDLTLEAARRARADGVGHFVFLSSMIVYGDPPPAGVRRAIGPDTPLNPANAYGRSKLEAEQGLLALADERFRVAILRPPMVFGRGCKGNYNALVRFAKKLPCFPDFDNARSVVYVENLAECIRLIIDGGMEGLFFPRQERPVATSELTRRIALAHGRRLLMLKCLNPAVRLLGRRGTARRAFGDMAYAHEMPDLPEDYRLWDLDAAIRRTESEAR